MLEALSKCYPLEIFKADIRNYDDYSIDFVYTSAKIEGNTYDRLDTDNLLRLGITAGGKRYSDAVMLLNLREAFDLVMSADSGTVFDLDYLGDLHKVVTKDLLPIHEQGIVRTSPVRVTATTYKPLEDAGRLRTEVKFILSQAEHYADVFEQAVYLHCNLAYLQYFRDGNKRTARLMQTAALVRGGVLPLFFQDALIDRYQRAVVHYYETGDYRPYVDFFKDNYQRNIRDLTGEKSQEEQNMDIVRQRITMLVELKDGTEVERLFYRFAHKDIERLGNPMQVNWDDVERRMMADAIGRHRISAEVVAEMLIKRSPGAATPDKQQALREDAKRLEVLFLESQRKSIER